MAVATIPKRITKGEELVIIPRKEYEELLGWTGKRKRMIKFQETTSKDKKWFLTKAWQRKEKEADEDIKAGRISGPFSNTKDLMKHLNGLKKKNN